MKCIVSSREKHAANISSLYDRNINQNIKVDARQVNDKKYHKLIENT